MVVCVMLLIWLEFLKLCISVLLIMLVVGCV